MPQPHGHATGSGRPRILRFAYTLLGGLFLALGMLGLVLPGFPGTPFLLVAAWLFSLSNERLHRWMMTNRWFGQILADYHAGLGIPRRIKAVAVGCVVVVVAASVTFFVTNWLLRITLVVLAVVGIVFILTRPTREDAVAAS